MTGTKTVVLPEFVADNLNAPFKVILRNSVKQTIDPDGNVLKTTIPNPIGLLHQVAIARLVCPRKMTGGDIRFVRNALGMRAVDVSEMISVSPEHLSRCEAGDRVLSPGAEKCLRISLILESVKLPEETENALSCNDKAQKHLKIYREALRRLQEIVKNIEIENVHSSECELVLEFYISRRYTADNDDDHDHDGDWHDQFSEAA